MNSPACGDADDARKSNAVPRAQDIDALRGFALMGIIVVNAPYFAFPVTHVPNPTTLLDGVALLIGNSAFAGKFFLMFSFLFGFGFARILQKDVGDPVVLRGKFARRLLALFAFGLAHAIFLFPGDILMLYAILGSVLWLCRKKPVKTLLMASGVIYFCAAAAQVIVIQEAILHAASINAAMQVAAGQGYLGSFTDAVVQRINDLPVALGFVALFNGLPALAMFLVGLAAGRSGVFPPSRETLRKHHGRVRFALISGLLGSSASFLSVLLLSGTTQEAGSGLMTVSLICFCICAPVLSFGMALTVLSWAQNARHSALVRWLAATGSSSLSGYILHSIILGSVFMGWGLGLFGALRPAVIMLVAFATFSAVVIILNVWKRWFRYGPDEWLLRSFVDLSWKPIRNEPYSSRT